MIICGHQPEYLPYLGLIHKALHCDKFIFVDHVQYKHKNFQNRNQIRSAQGAIWLTVPISGHHRLPIEDIKIDNTQDWGRKHLESIKAAYGGTPFFNKYFPMLEEAYNAQWDHLVDLDMYLTEFLFREFGVTAKILRSSDLDFEKTKDELLVELCQKYGGDTYLQGSGGHDYLTEDFIKNAPIKIIFSDFKHPSYQQKFHPFIPNMSAIDLLFNYGPESKTILLGDEE